MSRDSTMRPLNGGSMTRISHSLGGGGHGFSHVWGLRACRIEDLEPRVLLSSIAVTNTNDSGPGSLRQAILSANSGPGADTITFNIPGTGVQTIAPASPLPAVTDTVI